MSVTGTDNLLLADALPPVVAAFVTRRPLLALRAIKALSLLDESDLTQAVEDLESP